MNQTIILREATLIGASNNIATMVSIASGGNFIMKSGTISGNTSINNTNSGGVYISKDINGRGSFTMSGGAISGNTGGFFGGGEINNNTAGSGGGVCVRIEGIFTKSSLGGAIYGKDNLKTNTAKNGDANGHAVFLIYYNSTDHKYRDSTVGEGEGLSFDQNGNRTGFWDQ